MLQTSILGTSGETLSEPKFLNEVFKRYGYKNICYVGFKCATHSLRVINKRILIIITEPDIDQVLNAVLLLLLRFIALQREDGKCHRATCF